MIANENGVYIRSVTYALFFETASTIFVYKHTKYGYCSHFEAEQCLSGLNPSNDQEL
jgi:hypothetical protein